MKIDFGTQSVDLASQEGGLTATIGDRTFRVDVRRNENGQLDLRIDGRDVRAYVTADGAASWVTVNGRTARLTKAAATQGARARHEHAGSLGAPMPGQVKSVVVKAGEAVHKGQTLLVLEAMKMEMRVQAPHDGKVRAVHVQPGQTVEREQILIEVEE